MAFQLMVLLDSKHTLQGFFFIFFFFILFIVLEEICPKLHIGYNLGRRGEGVTSR
jgi:hypothetical protein